MSKFSIDRVNEAYYGALGSDFSKKTRDRVNWIVTHVEGEKVLDIGCSQGINSILLGREGKKVDAIDISQESIDFAKTDLEKEHSTVQELVSFRVANFMADNELESDYSTILLTEVLEHISDPDLFLQKVSKHLKIDGKLIVTVPFGINDFIDHKRTYYYSQLVEQLQTYFQIESVTYLGKWTGVTCKAGPKKGQSLFTIESIRELEDAFYVIEREYVDKVDKFLRDNHKYKKENNELLKEVEASKKARHLYDELKGNYDLKEEFIRQLQIETVELLNREEEALKAALVKTNQMEELNRKISQLEHRYHVLKRSRFGRVQLKYWEIKKKLSGRGKK